jgi:hypothetical protein
MNPALVAAALMQNRPYAIIGMADVQVHTARSMTADRPHVLHVLLMPPETIYRERRADRDHLVPAKRHQGDWYAGFKSASDHFDMAWPNTRATPAREVIALINYARKAHPLARVFCVYGPPGVGKSSLSTHDLEFYPRPKENGLRRILDLIVAEDSEGIYPDIYGDND